MPVSLNETIHLRAHARGVSDGSVLKDVPVVMHWDEHLPPANAPNRTGGLDRRGPYQMLNQQPANMNIVCPHATRNSNLTAAGCPWHHADPSRITIEGTDLS